MFHYSVSFGNFDLLIDDENDSLISTPSIPIVEQAAPFVQIDSRAIAYKFKLFFKEGQHYVENLSVALRSPKY